MVREEIRKKESVPGQGKEKETKLPQGKVRCFISKQILDEKETVELEYNGAKVRVHKRYAHD